MTAIFFIGFVLFWTALLSGGAFWLSRDPVPARFAHTIWRGAAILSVAPWIIALVYMVLPKTMAAPIPDMPYIGEATAVLATTPAVQVMVETAASPAWGMIFWAILAAGWATRLAVTVLRQVRLQAIKSRSLPETGLSAANWAHRLKMRDIPDVRRIPSGSPFLAGISTRTIYLPEAVTDPADASVIFAHECTHIARGDLITRPLERLVADIFWFSPFSWMMRRQLDYWREAACDQQTAALTGDQVGYARALASTARLVRPSPVRALPVAAFILPRRETLKKRLTQLLESDPQKPRRVLAVAAFVMGLIAAPMALAQGLSTATSSVFTHAVIVDDHAKISYRFGKVHGPDADKQIWHSGVDIKAPKYTKIYAPADAKVLQSTNKRDYGNTVDILLEDGRKLRFAQMYKSLVHKGQHIKAGDLIGKVGESGSAFGTHLHFEVFQDGEHVDPESVEGLILCDKTGA